ncbi:hypothetical protein BS47DRAFT_1397761 [Hydnum rufescens UP504]|uniref:Uncharacterized protein n=1 Tax=Hydnum rufescens UP504 TaxID=1448309 RepID=A0A9P6DRI3_9AGAM|nr:hypothetical protein BS47DRAFT_1397761 [Hydnum rufescens UP504]
MEMMIRAHSNRVMSVGFMTMMWPTSGPVDAIIRQICRLVNEGHSTTWAPNLLPDESFGFAKSPPVWHIKLDLNLKHPEYSKPAESSASHQNLKSPRSSPTLRSHHSNTRSTKALASKSRTKAPPKISPKSRVPQKTCSINPPETSSKSDEEDADLPTTLKDPKSRARIGAGPAVPQGESSVSQGAGSDTQSCDGADDDATWRLSRLVIEIDSSVDSSFESELTCICGAARYSSSVKYVSVPPALGRVPEHTSAWLFTSTLILSYITFPSCSLPQSPPPPLFSSPCLTTQTALDNTRNMDPDHVDDNEGMHLGGQFSAEQAHCLGGSPSKFQRNGSVWNAFQSSYCQSNPNLDSSVSASEYTSNVVRPAYLKLIESFGGKDSDTWAAEATRLITEHDGVKAAAAKQIAQSGGDIARIMSAQKEKWTHNMQWLATMDVHAMFIMVSGNAASPAAHVQNECRLGSIEMSKWFNTKFSMAAEISDIYHFILSKRSQHEALCEFTAEESQKKRAFDLSNVYKTWTAVKGMLAALFRPYVEFSVFPWTNLAKILIEHKLILRNFLPNAQFPNFSSEYSDHYGTSHWKALYFALQDTNPERKVTLSSLDDWPEGDASDILLIVDHNGDVILSLKGARDAASKKKIRELSSDLRKGTKRAKGKRKSTLLSSAYINSESDNAVESDPSGPSKVHLGNELQPQPKPRPHFSNSQASPSVSGVTSAPPPPLIDLPRTDWRGVDLSYFDPASFDNTFNAYPGSVNGTMDCNADMISLCQTSTLQHSDYPGTAQPDDLFGFSMGHQQGHAEIGMHDFGGPSTMSDGLNYENGVAHNSMDVTWGLDSLGLSTSFQQC